MTSSEKSTIRRKIARPSLESPTDVIHVCKLNFASALSSAIKGPALDPLLAKVHDIARSGFFLAPLGF
jgi:hypothetical protein